MKIKEEEKVLIPGTFDPVFKEIFTCKECRNYTCSLISRITNIDFEYLKKNLKVVNTTLPIQRGYEKGSNTDVLLSINKNIINLEMNNEYYDGVYEKNDLYGHKIISRTMDRGEEYKDYKTLIQINIDNFDKFKKIISEFRMMEIETGELESKSYIKYRINLPKIMKKYYNKEKLTYLERLLFVIGNNKLNDLEVISVGDETIMEYEKKIKYLSDDERFVDLYDREEAAKLEQRLKEKYYNLYWNRLI